MGRIRVGVAGWSYPDWEGIVYPRGPSRTYDRLAFLSRFVEVVEINATFYRPAAPRTARSWARRVPRDGSFRFTAKVHRSWTHDLRVAPREAVAPTLDGLAPLREEGLLGALLLQFPQSFHLEPRSLDRLERLLREARGWPVVVEVRHVSWDDPRVERWFRERDVGWCVVDQPRVGRSTAPLRPRATSSVGYLRLHGRNARNWFREGAGRDERYDYLYSARELAELAEAARSVGRACRETYVIQNNHFRGQALVNALQMRRRITGTPPRAPASLVAVYPRLREDVEPVSEGLFPPDPRAGGSV